MNDRTRTPQNEKEPVTVFLVEEPVNRKISIQVGYGPSNQEFEINSTDTVRTVLANPFIQEVVGFSDGGDNVITINGRAAEYGDTLQHGDQLEVIKRAGEKA